MKKGSKKKSSYPNTKNFALVPETLLASVGYGGSPINSGTLVVYCAVDRFLDKRLSPAVAFPSLETIGRRTSQSRETVSRHLSTLNDAGFLKRMYACRIQGKGILDSINIIEPVSKYETACINAARFKKKTGIGAVVSLIIYQPNEYEPSVERLVQIGFLPKSTLLDQQSIYNFEGGDIEFLGDTPDEQKSSNPAVKPQKNDNNCTRTTLSENEVNEAISISNLDTSNKGPWSKFISKKSVDTLVELEADEDVDFLTTVMSLQFLGKLGSMRSFEASRLKDKLWFLKIPTVKSVNYCQFKLAYIGFKATKELSDGLDLISRHYKKQELVDVWTCYGLIEHLRPSDETTEEDLHVIN